MDPLRLLCCAVDEAALVGSPLEMAMGEEDSKRAAIYIAGGRRRRGGGGRGGEVSCSHQRGQHRLEVCCEASD